MRPPPPAEYFVMSPDAKPDKPEIGSLDTAVDALTQRMHDELNRQVKAAFGELVAKAQAEADRAAETARRSAAAEVAAAVANAEEKTRAVEAKTSQAVDAAYRAGTAKGHAEGREQALVESKEEAARAVREALAGAEQTTHMAIEAAESAARARIREIEQSLRQQIEVLEREARRDLDTAKETHRATIDEIHAASRNELEAERESSRQRLKDAEAAAREQAREAMAAVEAEMRQRIEVAVAAATTAARADLRSADGASGERLLDAIRAIDRGRSLGEILDTLAACAGREAKAAAVVIVRGRHIRCWRSIGFGPPGTSSGSIEVPYPQAGIVASAAESNTLVTGGPAPSFAADAGNPVAIPVAISGTVVAVLFADQPASLQTLETIARHAARALESMTAFKSARALAAGAVDPFRGAGAPGMDKDEDVAAKRYARLLIAEIRLYHEAAVTAGRRDRDLTSRLGGEIARARVLYEQRIPPHVRQRADHFRDELVRTLADGDAALVDASA
jgi:hypothetical protein